MDEFKQNLKIPKKRVAVLIGTDGETKEEIEKQTNTSLDVDSEGAVTISSENSLDAWLTKQIVKAIGRGFSPKRAFRLLEENAVLELIDLKEWSRNENDMKRIKGRVIGREGKSKKTIQELTGTDISVFGKTISIIGDATSVQTARKAVEMLLSGAKHATVFKLLEKEKKKKQKNKLLGW